MPNTDFRLSGRRLLEILKCDFAGLDTCYRLANGLMSRRVYLDSAATCLPLNTARYAAEEFLRHYANTHSSVHFSARVSSTTYRWAHERILSFLGADTHDYTCLFVGSGATAGFNRVAHLFHDIRPQHDTVLVSLMEHHSNDLPHRRLHKQVIQIPLENDFSGRICLESLRKLLSVDHGRVNYVAVTAASNVTGICNPITEIAALAHEYGAYVVVDASQAIAHRKFCLSSVGCEQVDAFVFSGHKLYAPGSPGVLVCRKSLLDQSDPYEIGGGTVDNVYADRYELLHTYPEREEAGTPNIVGAVTLALAVELLERIGMEEIEKEERLLHDRLVTGLASVDGVRIYGIEGVPLEERTPTLVLAMQAMDHGLLAAVLNDYYNIAVRNQCFCAHPYVRELIKRDLWILPENILDDEAQLLAKQGLVRISLGLYNDDSDIDHLLSALREISKLREFYHSKYQLQLDGSYLHRKFVANDIDLFNPMQTLDRAVRKRVQQGQHATQTTYPI
jgi:selenocysteine lyase/cysteine desulfurase